ncbi:MAG TPA: hypothetical protein VGE94_03310 [Chloroflexota bacterium]
MPAPQNVVQAVQAAIVASAHLAAFENVTAAAQACQRLGSLSSGRWRSAARDLVSLEDDLEKALSHAAEELTRHAAELGLPEDALWTVGDAAGTLDLLREAALEEIDDEASPAAKILTGQVLYGTSFVEDPELPDRGTTLLFGWPEPLAPTTWPWQANWVVGDSQDDGEDGDGDELDLFESAEMEGDEPLLAELADELGCSRQDARLALKAAAEALTRASLLAGTAGEPHDDAEDEDESENGAS